MSSLPELSDFIPPAQVSMAGHVVETSTSVREFDGQGGFDLRLTAAPVAWGRGRWPNVDWIDGELVWAGWENGDVVVRQVAQHYPGGPVFVRGASNPNLDRDWLDAVLGLSHEMPAFSDPVLQRLALQMPGLRPFANGSLFDGVIGSIVGQSISVAAAATTERRLAALVHEGIEVSGRIFFPSPRAADVAHLPVEEVRSTGVTWRRAEAIVSIARLHEAGGFPPEPTLNCDLDLTRTALRALPLVGPWTAESALLWGLGMPDIYPSGDVALLRAAKRAYDRPDMTMKAMDELSRAWSPWRSWAGRLLWTDLLGGAGTER
jgi:3-methyladenine DNA glycosylase/8-oxoguanine DNA glycosylase